MPTVPRRPAKKGGSVTKPKAANVKRLNIKALSHLIARELFTNYHGEVVGQLRLMEDCTPLARSYGGWGEECVADVIDQQLRRALREVSN